MASYGVTNIPSIVTDAFNDAVGKTAAITKIDSTNFVDCGRQLSDFDLLDGWYGSLAKRIIKVLFFAKNYNADTRQILKDENTFGGFVEKLYTIAPDAVNNPVWQYAPDASTRKITQVSPYGLEDTLQVKSVLYGEEGTWSYEFVMPMTQLKKAWQTPAEMVGFLDSQFIPVRNKIEAAKESLIAAAVNTSIAKSLSTGHCTNLLGEYVSATGDTSVTSLADFLIKKEALMFGNKAIATTLQLMKRLSTKYNAESYETFSERPVVEVATDYAKASEFYLESSTFHKQLVELENYTDVPFWQYHGDTAAERTAIKVANDQINDGEAIDQAGIVAFVRDEENVAAYFGDEYEWSVPNVRQRVSNHGFQYNKGYAVDNFTNAHVFYIAPTGTITKDTSDAHVSAITCSPDYTEAGRDVAITVTCGEGYEVKKVTVTANSKTHDITSTVDSNGKYHYTPNDTSNITVAATSQAAG